MAFTRNVFLNCPFDEEYRAGNPRIDKIIRLIRESRFAIHDLSRCQAKKPGEYYRLNMPLELGMDAGYRWFGRGRHKSKRCLILETKPFRYQAAISDLAGSDIVVHNWLHGQVKRALPSPTKVYDAYSESPERHHMYETQRRSLGQRGHTLEQRRNKPLFIRLQWVPVTVNVGRRPSPD